MLNGILSSAFMLSVVALRNDTDPKCNFHKVCDAMTLSIMTFSIMSHSITTLSITTISTMTLSIRGLFVTLNK
jgi:hypothetical protein